MRSSYALRPRWYLSALGMITILLYYPTITELASVWAYNEDCNYGFLIIPVSLYLVWRKRRRLLSQPLYSSNLGIVFLLLWAVLYLLGTGAQILTLKSCSLIVFLIGVLLSTIGRQATRIVLFPIVFLLFMVPVPSEVYTLLTSPLQLFTTGSAAHILEIFHIPPVFREGNLIHLPNYSMQAAAASSGLRCPISIIALSILMGYLLFSSNIQRVVLLLVSIPAVLLANILMITITGFVAYQASPQAPEGFLSTAAGISTFCLSFLILLGSAFLIRWIERIRMLYVSWSLR